MAECGLLLHSVARAIEPLYGKREAMTIALMVLSHSTNLTTSQLLSDPKREVGSRGLEAKVARLAEGYPVQYLLGTAQFLDFEFEVAEGVLIPRPETEELVLTAVHKLKSKNIISPRVLDVGCGSGCISVSIKKLLPDSRVTALDISTEALDIARRNAQRHSVGIDFREGDALCLGALFTDEFDMILSNPPYIPESEIDLMRRNVVDYEPHLALFVPDDDPLKFYRAITRSAFGLLSEGGVLGFEVHENYARQCGEMILGEGFSSVEVLRDIFEKERMVWAQR